MRMKSINLKSWPGCKGTMEIKVKIVFGVPYNRIIGFDESDLVLDCEQPTVKTVVKAFLEKYPDLKNSLSESGLIHKDLFKALFVVNGKLAALETRVKEDCIIDVLIPMSGG